MTQLRHILPANVVPKRLVESKEGPDGRTLLLVPRFRKGFFAKWLQPRLKKPYINVKLDEIGSFVWNRIDGVNTVEQIALAMQSELGKKAEPVKKRLDFFLINLYKNKFVEYLQKIS